MNNKHCKAPMLLSRCYIIITTIIIIKIVWHNILYLCCGMNYQNYNV